MVTRTTSARMIALRIYRAHAQCRRHAHRHHAHAPHTLQNSIPKMPLRGEVHNVSATASVCACAMRHSPARVHARKGAESTHVIHEVVFSGQRVARQVAEKLLHQLDDKEVDGINRANTHKENERERTSLPYRRRARAIAQRSFRPIDAVAAVAGPNTMVIARPATTVTGWREFTTQPASTPLEACPPSNISPAPKTRAPHPALTSSVWWGGK